VSAWRKFLKVTHRVTGWSGWVYGAGFGRSPSRWLNPSVLYVVWDHRKPATSPHQPSELLIHA